MLLTIIIIQVFENLPLTVASHFFKNQIFAVFTNGEFSLIVVYILNLIFVLFANYVLVLQILNGVKAKTFNHFFEFTTLFRIYTFWIVMIMDMDLLRL